jgi:hypothetical protein
MLDETLEEFLDPNRFILAIFCNLLEAHTTAIKKLIS